MRKITLDSMYFVFQDSDGILSFSIREYDDEPKDPRFLYDGEKQIFLLRRPGQIIALDTPAEEFLPLLARSPRVRFVETPEDSSEIVRQYDILVTKIDQVMLPVSSQKLETAFHAMPRVAI